MGSTNKTTNLALNQWVGTDHPKRDDWNSDNALIDSWVGTTNTKLTNLTSDRVYFCGTTSGTNNYSVNNTDITAYSNGLTIRVIIGNASTGASSISINGLGVVPVLDSLGNPITNGGLKQLPYQLCYNNGNFIVLGKGGGGNVTADKMLNGITATGDSGQVVGTIPTKGEATYNPSTTAQTITSGQYLGGVQTISPVTGTATPADVINGKTFSSSAGILVTGNATLQSLGARHYLSGTATYSSQYGGTINLSFKPSIVITITNDVGNIKNIISPVYNSSSGGAGDTYPYFDASVTNGFKIYAGNSKSVNWQAWE